MQGSTKVTFHVPSLSHLETTLFSPFEAYPHSALLQLYVTITANGLGFPSTSCQLIS